MTFTEVLDKLLSKEAVVEYQSLTSDKIHKRHCTIPRKFQSQGDKIVVWDMKDEAYHDIEIKTIISINPLEKT
tara:strand:- start:3253 stop:3471 length:219 start_codon:yes stop_codon:yes gene_type:complete